MKVLLIGSSFSAVPFLTALKEWGAEVTVMGKFRDDPCHAFADASIYEDYSDPQTLLEVCQANAFDYIVPTCNDYSYVAGSSVAEVLEFPGFDSPEVTAILHTKDRFRQFCSKLGLPAPQVLGEVGAAEPLPRITPRELPLLVKPVDSFSGRGVELVHDADELADAVARAQATSRSGRVVLEQFVEGGLHSHTAFVADGEIIWHDFVDEFCEVYRYQVDRSAYPSSLTAELRAQVHAAMSQVVAELNLCDGLLHTQFIASADRFWIIETMRRCPGDLYGHHFRFSTGFAYETQFVAGFVGRKPQPPVDAGTPSRIERRVLSVDAPQGFFGIGLGLGGGQAEAIYVPLKESGGKLLAAPFDKAGILFLRGGADQTREDLACTGSRMITF